MKVGDVGTKGLTDRKKLLAAGVQRILFALLTTGKFVSCFFMRMEEVDVKDLLYECSKNTGCDEETVEKVVTCFLNTVVSRLSEGRAVDLGDNFGTFMIKESIGNVPKNSLCTLKTDGNKVFFLESSKLRHRIKGHPADSYASSIGLLESLQVQVGCMYLSDLHIPSNLPLVQSALRKIEPDNYGLREWNDAVCYITGQDTNFDSQRDAAKYLMSWNR